MLAGMLPMPEMALAANAEPVEAGLRAAIQEALGPEAFPPANEDVKLLASDGAANEYFGWSVAVSGDTALVGAWGDSDSGLDSGSAILFERNQGGEGNWGQVTKLTASDGAAGDEFGASVAISGDTVLVGAPRDDDNGGSSGSAYIFERDQGGDGNWGQAAKLTASDGAAGDVFGISVSLNGDTALVGADYDDDNGTNSGSAYLFERYEGGDGNWGETVKLNPSDGAALDRFGFSVAINGDTALVSAYLDDDNGGDSGSAYFFERDQGGAGTWGETVKITASDGAGGEIFGFSVALSGDTALVGTIGDNDNGYESGSAYIFERDQGGAGNWGQVKKIIASDGNAGDLFGYSVVLSGDTALVGAWGDDDNGLDSGSAYLFERDLGGGDNWGELAKVLASDGESPDNFGISVALNGNTALVGAWFDNDNGEYSGAAYLFDISASLGDKVWLDLTPNGVQDAGEPGIGGVTVKLYNAGNVLAGMTTTATGGTYSFSGLVPGIYYVEFTTPVGYTLSATNQGGDASLDSDPNPSTGKTAPTSLSPYEDDTAWDAGLYRPGYVVGKVWQDADGDGVQDVGESGLDGVTVKLYNQSAALLNTTVTAGGGIYFFADLAASAPDSDPDPELPPGYYFVEFVAPGGYSFSSQDVGDDELDSDADPSTGRTDLFYLDPEETVKLDAGLGSNLLTNGSFENPLGAEWTEIISDNGDGRAADGGAQDGGYVYLFEADGGLEVVKQTVVQSGAAGDEYTISFYFSGQSLYEDGYMGARLILKNGGVKVDKQTCIFTPSGDTFSWTLFTCTITATGDFDSIDVFIGIRTMSYGTVKVDAAILSKTGP